MGTASRCGRRRRFRIGVLPAGGAEPPSYKLRVDAVAYHLPGRTARASRCGRGSSPSIPTLIPLGTRFFVPGYGRAVAADVGVAIKGRIIDLWMPTDDEARDWGRKTVVITVFRSRQRPSGTSSPVLALVRMALVAVVLAATTSVGASTAPTHQPLPSSESRSSARSRRRASRGPHGGARGRSAKRTGRLRGQLRPGAGTRLGREARRVLRGAALLGPGLPLSHRGRRRGRARRPGLGRQPLPRRVRRSRRSRSPTSTRLPGRSRRGASGASRSRARRREAFRLPARGAGLEAVVPREESPPLSALSVEDERGEGVTAPPRRRREPSPQRSLGAESRSSEPLGAGAAPAGRSRSPSTSRSRCPRSSAE